MLSWYFMMELALLYLCSNIISAKHHKTVHLTNNTIHYGKYVEICIYRFLKCQFYFSYILASNKKILPGISIL